MSSDVIELLVLFALAAVVLYRLKTVIGTRTGHEAPPEFLRRQQEARRAGVPQPVPDVVTIPDEEETRGTPESGRAAVEAIRRVEPGFSTTEFLGGARHAYEMILMAYEEGRSRHAALAPLARRLPGIRAGHHRARGGGPARRGALHRRSRGAHRRDRLRSRDADRRHHRQVRRRADHRRPRCREPRRRGRPERNPAPDRPLDLQPRDGLERPELAADRHRRLTRPRAAHERHGQAAPAAAGAGGTAPLGKGGRDDRAVAADPAPRAANDRRSAASPAGSSASRRRAGSVR